VLSNLFDPQSADAVEQRRSRERCHAIVCGAGDREPPREGPPTGSPNDFLTTLLLAARAPVLMAPAMDAACGSTRPSLPTSPRCAAVASSVLEPDTGALASGPDGRGRFPEVDDIVEALRRVLAPIRDLAGDRLLVTAGPHANRSTRCGTSPTGPRARWVYGLAVAALRRGAQVTLISGRRGSPRARRRLRPGTDCEEMREAVLHHLDAQRSASRRPRSPIIESGKRRA